MAVGGGNSFFPSTYLVAAVVSVSATSSVVGILLIVAAGWVPGMIFARIEIFLVIEGVSLFFGIVDTALCSSARCRNKYIWHGWQRS